MVWAAILNNGVVPTITLIRNGFLTVIRNGFLTAYRYEILATFVVPCAGANGDHPRF